MNARVRLAWVLAGFALYFLGLVIQAPAGLLGHALERASAGQMQVYAARGSLWRGEAARVDWRAEGGGIHLGRIAWRWQPGALLRGRLQWAIELTGPGRSLAGSVGYGLQGIVFERLDGQMPAWLLGRMWPTLGLLHPGGRVAVQSDDLRIARQGGKGSLSLDWRDARSALVREPLGAYRLQLTAGPQARLQLRLTTLQGPLVAQGEGEWRPEQGLVFRATLQPPAANALEYAPALRLIGRADAGGVYRLEWRT